MRIIAGAFKGRTLASPRWGGLRPTSDRLRETLFNILGERVHGARVLDAYAGTGALGIEALSRGAAFVAFVERDPRALALIRENLRRCRVSEGCVIMRAASGLRRRFPEPPAFSLILIDPPYDERDLEAAIGGVSEWLTPDGLLVLEHARRRQAPGEVAGLIQIRAVASGDSALALYRRLASRAAGRSEAGATPADPEAPAPPGDE
jgi:16S rRNA (guanine(966)-N(2))-methyltransferase RsmD